MSGNARLLLMIIAVVFGGFFIYKIIVGLVATVIHVLISLVLPLVIVGSIAVIAYSFINRRTLGGGRRTLP